jgi:hypothetical protein
VSCDGQPARELEAKPRGASGLVLLLLLRFQDSPSDARGQPREEEAAETNERGGVNRGSGLRPGAEEGVEEESAEERETETDSGGDEAVRDATELFHGILLGYSGGCSSLMCSAYHSAKRVCQAESEKFSERSGCAVYQRTRGRPSGHACVLSALRQQHDGHVQPANSSAADCSDGEAEREGRGLRPGLHRGAESDGAEYDSSEDEEGKSQLVDDVSHGVLLEVIREAVPP